MPKATDPTTIARFAQLVGLGCTQHEAARAVKISERQGEYLLARPQVRALVEEARRKNGAGLLDDVRNTIDELLKATDANGSPDYSARARGAELLMRHREQFDDHDAEERAREALPEGVYEVYPLPHTLRDEGREA
jgi:hypothetical protein